MNRQDAKAAKKTKYENQGKSMTEQQPNC